MSGMNEWLARAYGTNGAGYDSDLEKTAQAMMLTKLAEQEGIDLSGLDEQQLTLLAQEVAQQMAAQQQGAPEGAPQPGGMPGMPPAGNMGGPGAPSAQTAQPPAPMPSAAGAGPGPAAPGEGQFSQDQIKVAQAKMAEADFLGRMMAHALHHESILIKQAEEAKPFAGKETPAEEKKEQKMLEEEEAEKTATAFLAARGYSVTKTASAEGPLTRAIRALGGSLK